jgi:F-type H+-transporting ATPase subunit epsilon
VPVTLHVELVVPDREVWSGSARMVVAKTQDGDIGILGSHPPVIGLLAEGSVVTILDADASGSAGSDGASASEPGRPLVAAVSGGFLSVAGDRVSILARHAELASEIDAPAVRAELEETAGQGPGGEETAEVKYARARLRATGEQA